MNSLAAVMTKDTTGTAPFTMKIKVVAPPGGNIFFVGAKRFHCAEVLPTKVFRSCMVDGKTSVDESASRFLFVLLRL